MILLSTETIEKYFYDYLEDNDFAVKSYPGFFKYLVKVKKFDKSSIRDTKAKFIDDIDLLNFIKTYCEGDLIDLSLQGIANPSMAQFVLKNKHGYDTNVVDNAAKATQVPVINIVMDKNDS